MKKIILFTAKSAMGIILCSSLATGCIPSYSGAASDKDTADALSGFKVIHREYDSTADGLIHYHYKDEDGNTVEFSNTAAKGFSSRKKAASVPSSYDLRRQNVVTSIKNQGQSDTCWAFAVMKSIESNLAMQGVLPANQLDLSESHLTWYTYHPSASADDPLFQEGAVDTSFFANNTNAYYAGGNAILSSFVLSRWSGAVTEDVAPLRANSSRELTNTANDMAAQSETLRYRSDYLVTDIICYDDGTQEQIKEAIMKNGAMDVSYYHIDNATYHTTANGTAYYQKKVTGKNAKLSANHSVTIVGWDDSFSKENFGTYKPSSDGAWLIANSYGSAFGDNGYFWLSYEEPSLTEFYSFIATTPDTYDNNYQYDGYGWGNAFADSQSDTTKAANIFTANSDYQQSLTAVGIYTLADSQPYTVKIYRGVTADKPESGTLASTASGTIDFQGYHTIPLEQAVSLNPDERFSVVITYQKTNEDTGYIPLEGDNYRESPYYVTYTSNAGESFVYNSGTSSWTDLHSSRKRGISNNLCIKAFTKNTMASGSIALSRSSIKLGAGESYALTATVRNIQDTSVTYTSSNPAAAEVDSSGRITAKAAGKAVITATLISGKSESIAVTVKKAPSKITLSPAKKKTIKKSKSFRIKVKLPSNSYSSNITYTSSKPAIAKVTAAGKVTGLKKGKAVITVKTHNGKTAKITVTVN